MNRTETLLLQLLRSSLWGTSSDPVTLTDLQEVMTLAKTHTVDGLIAGLVTDNRLEIEDCPEKEDAVMEMMGVVVKHERMYKKHCRLVTELDSILSQVGIPYVVFKGTAAASAYPMPWLRTMGDVDFYVPHADFGWAKDSIERKWNVPIEKGDSEKHLGFERDGVPFEMHHRIETFGSTNHQHVFDAMVDEGVEKAVFYDANEGHACKLPPEEDIIVVFKHMFNHLLVEGVGLRQVVDVAVMLNAYKSSVDVKSLRQRMTRLGYIRAFDATVAMLGKYLGMPYSDFYSSYSNYYKWWGEHILKEVLRSGNFGRKAYKNQEQGLGRSLETASRAMRHCIKFFPLLPTDMPGLILRHTATTIHKHFIK